MWLTAVDSFASDLFRQLFVAIKPRANAMHLAVPYAWMNANKGIQVSVACAIATINIFAAPPTSIMAKQTYYCIRMLRKVLANVKRMNFARRQAKKENS